MTERGGAAARGGRPSVIGGALLLGLLVLQVAGIDRLAAGDETTTLVVWDGFVGAEGDAARRVYAAFAAANPGIAVERREVAAAASSPEEVARALSSGVGPDLIGTALDGEFRSGLAAAGLLVPLNELPVPYDWTQRIDGVAQRWARRDGRLLTLPVDQEYLGVYVNRTLLDEAGLAAPRTEAELLDFCRRARAMGYGPVAVGSDPAAELSDLFVMAVNNRIGPTVTKNLFFTDWGTWDITRVGWSLRLVAAEMPSAGCFDVADAAPADAQARFVEGRTLLLPASSAAAPELEAAMAESGAALEMVPFPRTEGGRGRVLPTAVGGAYGLVLRSAHPREAAELLDFLVSEEAVRIWVEEGRMAPPLRFDVGGWRVSPLQSTLLDLPARARRRSPARASRVEFGYQIGPVAPPGFEAAIAAGLRAVLNGEAAPERVATELQAVWTEEPEEPEAAD